MKHCNIKYLFGLLPLLVVGCGDPSGPPLSNLTPAILTASFTGDSTKVSPKSLSPNVNCEITLSWTVCGESEFDSYVLHRSESPNIEENPEESTVLGVFQDANISSTNDLDIQWSTEYFYALKSTDTNDGFVWSNEVSVNTPDLMPDSIITAINAGAGQQDACLSPDGMTIYILRGDQLIVANTMDYSVSRTVQLSSTSNRIAITESGGFLYLANYTEDTVSVIRVSDYAEVALIPVGDFPYDICAISRPDGEYIYVCNTYSSTISVISVQSNTVSETISVSNGPLVLCSLPTDDFIYVGHNGGKMSVISTFDNDVTTTIDVDGSPQDICAHPEGEYIYMANVESLARIRTSDNTVVAYHNPSVDPLIVTSLENGKYLYVSDRSTGISILRTTDYSVVTTLQSGNSIRSITPALNDQKVFITTTGSWVIALI